jgi:hypothetical protein
MRRGASKNVYGLLIVAMVLVAFVLQYHWMQRVRELGADGIAPNTFAEKLSRWMLHKRGVSLDDPAVLGQIGTERIPCETCGQTGTLFSEAGAPVPCPICLGVGFRMIRRFDAADYICPACAGMGRVEMPDTGVVDTCPRCGGRGLVQSTAVVPADPAE